MTKNQWNDKRIIDAISGGTKERNAALRYIFKNLEWKSLAIRHVRSHGGNEQDGEDVFQDAIILFDRNLRQGVFQGNSTLKTYFYSIVKWHWLGQLRKKRPQEEFAPKHERGEEESVEARVIGDEKKSFLQKALDQIGPRCKKILNLYGQKYTMEEIAKEMSLANANMAKKATYRCRQDFSAFFKNHPEWVQFVK